MVGLGLLEMFDFVDAFKHLCNQNTSHVSFRHKAVGSVLVYQQHVRIYD